MRQISRVPAPAALIVLLLALLALLAALALALGAHPATARAAGALDAQCRDPNLPAARNPANPLMLATAPRDGDVLSGAHFFVAGPARGQAAGAIAQLLGYARGQTLASGQPLGGFSDSETYARFTRWVAHKERHASAHVRRQIALLEKIAVEPTPLRISSFSGGGSDAAIYAQTRKLFCTVLRADPHTIPIVTTYFLHAELGGCSTRAQIAADTPRFTGQIDAMARAIGRRPVVLFDELDAVGSSQCMTHHPGALAAWEGLVRYEARTLEALPHTAVYLEGGYSDSGNAGYAARLLNRMGVRSVQGFFTNDTHLQWTSHELRYAKLISRRTGNSHFVINTSSNGRGPLLNPDPRTQGVEDLCNPPNRGLGIRDSTAEQRLDRGLDALMWIVPPGNSSGACNGGTPSGTFWVARAISLAAHANGQLGPGFPSRPY